MVYLDGICKGGGWISLFEVYFRDTEGLKFKGLEVVFLGYFFLFLLKEVFFFLVLRSGVLRGFLENLIFVFFLVGVGLVGVFIYREFNLSGFRV